MGNSAALASPYAVRSTNTWDWDSYITLHFLPEYQKNKGVISHSRYLMPYFQQIRHEVLSFCRDVIRYSGQTDGSLIVKDVFRIGIVFHH